MKYTVDKGIEGVQDILVISKKEHRISRYIRVTESMLANPITLIYYNVSVECEEVEDEEIIVNLTVKAMYKDKVSIIKRWLLYGWF